MRRCTKHYKAPIDTIMEREEGLSVTRAISRIVFYFRRHCYGELNWRIAAYAVVAAVFALPAPADAAVVKTIVRMETNLGSFNVGLYDDDAPKTVENFLNYVTRKDYDNGIIHRSLPGMVIQGGGYKCCNIRGQVDLIPTDAPVPNEFDPSRSNIRGTIAMAKSPATDDSGNPIPGGGPDSATSQWFFNLADNSGSPDTTPQGFDYQNGGFTVFGHVLDSGMGIVDEIGSLQRINAPGLPSLPIFDNYYVIVSRVCVNNDGDGACPETEDKAPGGDGNGDRIPDRDQANVTTILTQFGTTATFEAEPTMRLNPVGAVSPSTVTSLLTTFKSPPDQSVLFNNGMFQLTMLGNMSTIGHTLTVYDGAATRPTHYYAYGPTLDNHTPHWYDFAYDQVTGTGAEIMSDRIILHFVDGKRGDDDLDPNNGSITHTGAQAVLTPIASTDTKSGGCSIASTPSQTTRGGDWIVVFLFLAFVALVRRRARYNRIQRTPR
jgi:cyclophilin family peptidyl-prolyl cis-trans isomerase